ncbi:L,D-transpeptidase family protein [Mucilaginibacter sp. HMF5004]|uniref:L,D-transpeptidase family protein n=1 Tax=Mucilaginibacter rivuli TaxID=2857527 RepID=UPI001C5EB024|nr:L,D-transpeptidase family protein [Mucilaginibacter rivuli]MBW4888835.1 L,D-transpeptidase family protein [Mucilaginibacter rivuli]
MLTRIIKFVLVLIILCLATYYFFPESKLPVYTAIDKILVLKSRKQLLVYSHGKLIKTYTISLGFCPKGKKQVEHDGKTPEGLYYINAKNPHSVCYKNLGISYPSKADILKAQQLNKPTGGDIKIHGLSNKADFIGKFHRWYNWTDGCIGVTNNEIDELYNHIAIGTPIEIKP